LAEQSDHFCLCFSLSSAHNAVVEGRKEMWERDHPRGSLRLDQNKLEAALVIPTWIAKLDFVTLIMRYAE